MSFMKSTILLMAMLVAAPAFAQMQAADDQTAKQEAENMQALQQQVQADRKELVASNIQLTESEADKFWPIYDGYIEKLKEINQRTVALIDSYAADYNSDTLTDEKAGTLLKEMYSIQKSELKLQQSYAKDLSKVLPEKKVARILQIENKLRAIVKYQLAAQIPLVQ